MPKIRYVEKSLSAAKLAVIQKANEIIREYQEAGFVLTLRQLYYQFVSRDLLPNKQTEYKRLGDIIADARLAGLIDWSAIEDRTRELATIPSWRSPEDIVESCATQFNLDRWKGQKYRPEVWIEKDALLGVIEPTCRRLDVPYFSCRGYTSMSSLWQAGRRLMGYIENGQIPVILHFGDHDPSGIDMTRDILDRVGMFAEAKVQVDRLALNMDQIEEFHPPPNPAKLTDSRAENYIQVYGNESWELDAVEPKKMAALITKNVKAVRDEAQWSKMTELRDDAREVLRGIASNWEAVQEFIRTRE